MLPKPDQMTLYSIDRFQIKLRGAEPVTEKLNDAAEA